MTSRRNTGLTMNCAPASITLSAVSASSTVPAPSRKPGGIFGASPAISSIAPGTVIVTSSARMPPSEMASTTRLQLRRVLDPDDGDDAGGFDGRRGGLALCAHDCD